MTLIAMPGLYCPVGCGETLMLVDEHTSGKIRCMGAATHCPDPLAAEKILSDPEKMDIVEFTGEDFRILHPLRERIGGSLFDCPVSKLCAEMGEPPRDAAGWLAPGRYRAWPDEDGILTLDLIPGTG